MSAITLMSSTEHTSLGYISTTPPGKPPTPPRPHSPPAPRPGKVDNLSNFYESPSQYISSPPFTTPSSENEHASLALQPIGKPGVFHVVHEPPPVPVTPPPPPPLNKDMDMKETEGHEPPPVPATPPPDPPKEGGVLGVPSALKLESQLMYAPGMGSNFAGVGEHQLGDAMVPPRPRSPPPPPPPNHEGEVGGHEPPPAPITPPPGSPKCQGASTLVPYETMPKACYDATLLLNQGPTPTSGRVHANSSGSREDNRPTPGRPNPPVVPPPPPPSKRGLRLLPHALGSGGGGPPIPGRPNQPVVGVPPKGSNRSGQLNVFLDEFGRHFGSPTPAFKSFAVKDPGFTMIHSSANWVAVG
ncbi:hypothetical protein BDV93DRAFT_604536 [Ceratobasidium sp. AG-I]|nr:hypothetical protein BDV93DRAFT_604536 [Ceratobasidium sp. AG-I]